MYETHITIEPVTGDRLTLAQDIALLHGFKVADLYMAKRLEDTPERSKFDTFMTGHAKEFDHSVGRMTGLCRQLKENGFKVWRYKIEQIVIDSKHSDDPLRLL